MRLLIILVFLPLLVCAIQGRADDRPGTNGTLPDPGRHRMTLTMESGQPVRYSLSMPEIENGAHAPLILALHYGGEVTPWYSMPFLEMLAAPAFEPLGAIIVAPDCPGRGWADPASEAAALALVRHALDHWPADPRRVAVTGFSMGGMGAWYLAARHPSLFSAALPVAGRPADGPPVTIPLYAIHSRQDEVIDLGPAKKAVKEMKERSVSARLVVLEDGPPHYRTAAFAPALRQGAKWLERLWEAGDDGPATAKE
jgi:predicted peptidase